MEEQHFYFFSPAHMSQGEFTACASHFWKQGTLLCKHWSYASLGYPWLHRCKELLSHILLVFQPLCLWGLQQQQNPWVWTRVYQGWQGDDIKYKSEYLNKLGSWYKPQLALIYMQRKQGKRREEGIGDYQGSAKPTSSSHGIKWKNLFFQHITLPGTLSESRAPLWAT